jgi:ubiquinone biosynthesis accessory factor UbiK
MADQKLIDEINERVRAVLAQSPAADLEKNMRAMLAALFSRLDLVTREEFDVQRQVLARTREKLVQLEAKVAELEAKHKAQGRRRKAEGARQKAQGDAESA